METEKKSSVLGKTMNVELEIIVAALNGEKKISYCLSRYNITDTADDPDLLVRNFLSDPSPDCPTVPWSCSIVHSTSWRYEETGSVVLTYLVYSDHAAFPASYSRSLPLFNCRGPKQENLVRPRPREIAESHVVLHGINHLSYLVRRNPAMQQILTPASLLTFKDMAETKAGKI